MQINPPGYIFGAISAQPEQVQNFSLGATLSGACSYDVTIPHYNTFAVIPQSIFINAVNKLTSERAFAKQAGGCDGS
jgi:hypothetical protein